MRPSIAIAGEFNSVTFRSGGQLRWEPFQIDLANGDLLTLEGDNGSGKTTVLRLLSRIYPEYRKTCWEESDVKLDYKRNGRYATMWPALATPPSILLEGTPALTCGYLSHAPRANICCNCVSDEIAFPLEHSYSDRQVIRDRMNTSLERLAARGINAGTPPEQLSSGQMQLVALEALISCGPDILFLDEPTSSLDNTAARQIANRLTQALSEQSVGCIVAASHDQRWSQYLSEAPGSPRLKSQRVTRDTIAGNSNDVLTTVEGMRWLQAIPRKGLTLDSLEFTSGGFTLSVSDLNLLPFQVHLLTGANGAGKSTFLDSLTGHRKGATGEMKMGDHRVKIGRTLAPPSVAYGFQATGEQLCFISIPQELRSPPKLPRWQASAAPVIERLVSFGTDNPWRLSYGQRKLLVLATLLHSADVVFLDEPFSCLDADSAHLLAALVSDCAQAGSAILIASNSHQPPIDVSKRFLIKEGKMVSPGADYTERF